MEEIRKYFTKKILRGLLFPLRLLPINRNQILLINDLGGNYSCNPKVIAEYLIKEYKNNYKIIYAVKDYERMPFLKEKGMYPVGFNSLKYFYYAMTSKVIVSNSGGYSYIPLRTAQYVINTHHGGGAYKSSGADMFKPSHFLKNDMLLQANCTDVFLSTNKRFTEVMARASYMPETKFWEIGMPRNDDLINENLERKEKIRQDIGLTKDEKLVLYAPTYRKPEDNYYKGSIAIAYNIDMKRVCEALKKRFGGSWKFAYRLHPCVENKRDYIVEGAMDLSDYEDMQDLLLVADVLINDFSSSFWDFMLTKKPAFLYAVDLKHYVETTKVYTPVADWPFPKAENNDQLIDNILNFDEQKYKKDCENHYKMLGGCETGNATELVCNRIVKECRKR